MKIDSPKTKERLRELARLEYLGSTILSDTGMEYFIDRGNYNNRMIIPDLRDSIEKAKRFIKRTEKFIGELEL